MITGQYTMKEFNKVREVYIVSEYDELLQASFHIAVVDSREEAEKLIKVLERQNKECIDRDTFYVEEPIFEINTADYYSKNEVL